MHNLAGKKQSKARAITAVQTFTTRAQNAKTVQMLAVRKDRKNVISVRFRNFGGKKKLEQHTIVEFVRGFQRRDKYVWA